jgi:hypothetical protein
VGQRCFQHPAPDHLRYQAMAKAYKPLPAAEKLWELFEYRPLTGELLWRAPTSVRVKPGAVAGSPGRNNGVDIRLHGKLYRAHRLVWRWVTGEDPADLELDHTNGNRRDNRYQNLRLATRKQNMWNIPSGGASQMPCGRYYSRIRAGGKPVYLGTFASRQEAQEAYKKAAMELHGAFAKVK